MSGKNLVMLDKTDTHFVVGKQELRGPEIFGLGCGMWPNAINTRPHIT